MEWEKKRERWIEKESEGKRMQNIEREKDLGINTQKRVKKEREILRMMRYRERQKRERDKYRE